MKITKRRRVVKSKFERKSRPRIDADDTTFPGKPNEQWSDRLLRDANNLNINEFQSQYMDGQSLTYSTLESATNISITLKPASALSSSELLACFHLVESTSRTDYENSTSFGWHPKRKQREMKEPEMRYLLVQTSDSTLPVTLSGLKEQEIRGFLSFMLTHDSTPSVPVLYIYEIHLAHSLRSTGLGKHLMALVENVAARVGVEKVMLTCFISNRKARGFYASRGYAVDECSPEDRVTRNKVVEIDYVIMSKSVKKRTKVADETGTKDGTQQMRTSDFVT